MLKILNKFDKRQRYLVFSFVMAVLLYFMSVELFNLFFLYRLLAGVLVVSIATPLVHFPNLKKDNYVYSLIMPIAMYMGALLTLKYFPNFGEVFRGVVIALVAVAFYIIFLVDNIFLVVEDREESIPLLRVALAWSQIMLVSVSIPLFAGIYKVPVNIFLQIFAISVFAFLFIYYQIWVNRHEERSADVNLITALVLAFLGGLYTALPALAVAFIPGEAFLRGLLTASGLMFGLMYTASHLKNEIDLKLVSEYSAIVFLFLIIFLIFN